MNIKPILFIFVFLIMIAAALAVQPQISVPTTTTSLTIVYGQSDCFKIGNTINYNFDVLDANYSKLSNVTTNCTFYMAQTNGSLITSGRPVYDATAKFWYYPINGTDLERGIYSTYIYCVKSASEAGFESQSYQFTTMGVCPAEDKSPLAAIILIPILFGILLMLASFLLDDDHKVLKIILFLFSYITIFISLWLGLSTLGRYYGFVDMQQNIGTLTWIFGIAFFVIISYFLIYAFIMSIQAAAQKKREKLGW